jgi:CDP-diacylglycerol--serine O-phosphatidyltransferase
MPFNPQRQELRRARFRAIPVRVLIPNLITLLALCAGLTGIRVAVEGKLELALAAIVFAAALDAIDGRIARMIKGTSRFGAELDSLADFVNFGCAPALILYFWGLHELQNVGWIAGMVFAICASLRLARFNVAIDDPNKPPFTANFFTGVPAPAGAILVLLPIYLHFLGVPRVSFFIPATVIYVLAIAFLMVSRVPVYSGKKLGTRVPPELVLPGFVLAVLFVALLIGYPWGMLTIGSLVYLASLPFGVIAYRRMEREYKAANPQASAQPAAAPAAASEPAPEAPPPPADKPHLGRLN